MVYRRAVVCCGDQTSNDDRLRQADHQLIEAQAGAGRADEHGRGTHSRQEVPVEPGFAANEAFCYLTTIDLAPASGRPFALPG